MLLTANETADCREEEKLCSNRYPFKQEYRPEYKKMGKERRDSLSFVSSQLTNL